MKVIKTLPAVSALAILVAASCPHARGGSSLLAPAVGDVSPAGLTGASGDTGSTVLEQINASAGADAVFGAPKKKRPVHKDDSEKPAGEEESSDADGAKENGTKKEPGTKADSTEKAGGEKEGGDKDGGDKDGPKDSGTKKGREKTTPPPEKADDSNAGGGTIAQPGRDKSVKKDEIVHYQPATPEESAAAIKEAREKSAEVEKTIKVKFTELETDHFLIFTDWNPREFAFLKKNLEGAYGVVSKQFNMKTSDNVFVGKLPVYMYATYDDFRRHAMKIDNFSVSSSVAGYYAGQKTGSGHMSMWKPNAELVGNNSIKDAEKLWAYVLVHEFTHAFLARYRTNEMIPRWLNEGIAEVTAYGAFPMQGRYQMANWMAWNANDMMFLFDDSYLPGGAYYPVMQTMVELMIRTDRKAFIRMIDEIKDGEDPEDSFRKNFKTGYSGFVEAWRTVARKPVR